ncbi:MAG: glycosyltransferase family 2 protein [Verrucomicrobiia bacterium]
MQPLPISVCMIAGNEAHRIRRALESVAGWTGEIIVVTDHNVTDGTGEIAVSCGAKVFCEPWQGHAAHRNFASGKASQPWLLAIDADEVVSPELRDEIRQVFVSGKMADRAAFSLPRCTIYHGRWIRHGDWYPDRKVRLWRRGQGRWSDTQLHETLVAEGRVGRLRNDLLHYSMESLEHQTRKTLSSVEDFVHECEKRGRSVRVIDLAFRPWWRFVRGYFLKLGFLDGWQGYTIAWMTAFYTFLRYASVREHQLQKRVSHE